MSNSINSVLILESLSFDTISFKRLGPKNNKNISPIGIETKIAVDDNGSYRVSLSAELVKDSEYKLFILLNGYFRFDNNQDVTEVEKKDIIQKNTVAIMMPYLRSEISLITAQPETDCIVLPPININGINGVAENTVSQN